MKLPNLNNVSLKISAGRPNQFPADGIPQIAFSGRSNVGKSSLINCLLGRKSLARVSGTPGKTITVNFYNVDNTLYFVDLPGYGFARRSADSKRVWSDLTDGYFVKNPNRDLLRLVVQLVDSRIGPTQDDTMMMEWMLSENIPFVLVGTKADKLKKSERDAFLTEMRESYLNGTSIPVLLFSSQTREGKEALWGHLTHALTR
ncbi:MAG: ribosome biogenesis GTP-binding protein YihA/YsxC [Clostridia bacterium]|nr:ribosome biogenesis GTP-binding protein YihA/YsxC [Clostridia bacterium]MDY6184625.1 ribosome biogenesis GTP-binding protein YihA/YsxC [Eubacteriales bacterium]